MIPDGPRFKPPRGHCGESCPAWALCRSLQQHDPLVEVPCEWADETVGIDPTQPPAGTVRWDALAVTEILFADECDT